MKVSNPVLSTFITDDRGIDLDKTFDCGQAFRFEKTEDGSFEGVALGKYLKIRQQDKKLYFYHTSEEDFNTIWKAYFDLDTDYDEIKRNFECDIHLELAADFARGIRILKQDPFEALISFIISANNNIPRIKKIINLLCQSFGKEIIVENKSFYTFPTANELADITIKDLEVIRAGFRAKYIIDAVQNVYSGEVNLDALNDMDYIAAKEELLKIKGVGEKVADCILLFGVGKYEAFPKDVWIKRIMNTCYGDCEHARFGKYAGIAQQYLFYYARYNN